MCSANVDLYRKNHSLRITSFNLVLFTKKKNCRFCGFIHRLSGLIYCHCVSFQIRLIIRFYLANLFQFSKKKKCFLQLKIRVLYIDTALLLEAYCAPIEVQKKKRTEQLYCWILNFLLLILFTTYYLCEHNESEQLHI